MKDNKDVDRLSHTAWRCQYHVVFAPKYRRMVIYDQIKKDIGQILRQLCEQKEIEIIEAEACPDHIHMLISFSPKYSISYVMGYLKGKSSLMIFDRHANLKYKYGNRHFWARGYFVDTSDQRWRTPSDDHVLYGAGRKSKDFGASKGWTKKSAGKNMFYMAVETFWDTAGRTEPTFRTQIRPKR